MEKVTGIGGVFLRTRDPETLARWYEECLGVTGPGASYDREPWNQEAGPTVFAPFPSDTTYLGTMDHMWMLNFRVRNLDAMVAQLRGAGVAVDIDPATSPIGRFAHLADPEGNRIELWEPADSASET